MERGFAGRAFAANEGFGRVLGSRQRAAESNVRMGA